MLQLTAATAGQMTAATASTGSFGGATLPATSDVTSSVSQTSAVVKEEELSSDIAVVEQSAEEQVMHACSNIAVYTVFLV
jgi:ABC-type polysaccharide/polyol phosphate export permease